MFRIKYAIYLTVIIGLILYSCAPKLVVEDTWPDGTPQKSVQKIKKTGHLLEYSYYADGQLEYQASYFNGKLDGPASHWGEDGKVLSTANYLNGNLHGEWIQYHKNGQMMVKTEYFHGKKHGYIRHYYPSGQIQSEVQYEWGEQISQIIRWDADGYLIY